jgi:hypothetical protein
MHKNAQIGIETGVEFRSGPVGDTPTTADCSRKPMHKNAQKANPSRRLPNEAIIPMQPKCYQPLMLYRTIPFPTQDRPGKLHPVHKNAQSAAPPIVVLYKS